MLRPESIARPHPLSTWRCISLALILILGFAAPGTTQYEKDDDIRGPEVLAVVTPHVFEADVRQLPRSRFWKPGDEFQEVEDLRRDPEPEVSAPAGAQAGAAMAPGGAAAVLAGEYHSPTSFDGIPATGWVPPDTVGDVGPNHYVQAVNISFAIYDKSGALLAGPSPINSLWAGFGGPCDTQNNGDPIVRYDHLANRWLVSQFALPAGQKHQCVAISRTPDPVAGGWYLYDFPTPAFPDYPKIGVWPDGYYMGTQRTFPAGGLDVYAFERSQMLVGLPAQAVEFFVPAPSLFLMPSDLDGPAAPAATPNFFVRQIDGDRFGGVDRLEIFEFEVDWSSPALSSFNQVATLPVAPFDSVLCVANLIGPCIPQPGTANRLESLTVWLMWRLQYRNFGTHESMVTNHTVDVGGDHAGIRWYELRRPPGGAWSIHQQGTYAPDATHRWMGSVAMNVYEDMALGYSVSDNVVFPGIRYSGRTRTDPGGSLPQGEVTVVSGGGSQTGSARYGNYSTMDVDPVDDCTFWYTTEYYNVTSAAGWRTRIASFSMPSCAGDEVEPPLDHRVWLSAGGLLTDDSLPLNSGIDFGFTYHRHRFIPAWSWEGEANIVATDDGLNDGLLGTLQVNLVRHLNGPGHALQPFLLGGLGIAHYNSLGVSDTGGLLTLGLGTDYLWKPKIGFRFELRLLGLYDVVDPDWTTNVQMLWGPTFSF